MSQIVECVPNFSEGRDEGKIKQITDAVQSVAGVELLNVDPGRDMNRTVAPLVQAADARVIDSSRMTIDEVVSVIVEQTRAIVASG